MGGCPRGLRRGQGRAAPVGRASSAALPASLVSMCSGRPVRIGGWDMALRRPKPRLAYMPAGTVYYFTTSHSGAEVVEALHDRKIGFDTRIGFGHIVVGRW
ncbi:MAG: type III-B CRISPR module-associated Cmr3 family protein [Limnochordia bacterium]